MPTRPAYIIDLEAIKPTYKLTSPQIKSWSNHKINKKQVQEASTIISIPTDEDKMVKEKLNEYSLSLQLPAVLQQNNLFINFASFGKQHDKLQMIKQQNIDRINWNSQQFKQLKRQKYNLQDQLNNAQIILENVNQTNNQNSIKQFCFRINEAGTELTPLKKWKKKKGKQERCYTEQSTRMTSNKKQISNKDILNKILLNILHKIQYQSSQISNNTIQQANILLKQLAKDILKCKNIQNKIESNVKSKFLRQKQNKNQSNFIKTYYNCTADKKHKNRTKI